tara:strand:+ start:146 stop:484 length:339 start_codon:yes stop_codon:yes gene_type:complete
MYASLARFGYNIAKSLRPSKIKKAFKSGKTKFTPKGDGFDKFRDTTKKLRSSAEIKLGAAKTSKIKKAVSGAGSKISQGYRSAYMGTLGTSTRRKVTSAVLGTSFLNDILDD